ncbi:MAG: PAS domain S-box protein [Candidatus Omnitrophota bacterium]
MRIQTRLIIVFVLCFLIFVTAVLFFYIIEKRGIERIFKIDARETEEEFDKVNNVIGESLDMFVYDYIYRDEMAAFMRTRDKEWAKANIETSMPTYKANAVWVYGLDENLSYKVQDLDDGFYDVLPLPKGEIRTLFGKSPSCRFFVNTPKGIMEIRGATIHPGDDKERKTPPQGYFFAGRLWDGNFLKKLSDVSGNRVTISAVSAFGSTEINVKKGFLAFFRTLPGWNGLPVSAMRIQAESDFIQAFNAFSRTTLFMLVGFAVAILFIVIASIVLWVIRPMGIILRSLFKEDPSYLARLAYKQDELGRIAHLIENFFKQRKQLMDEVTIRKRAEEDLVKEKELSESIIDTAQVILLLLDTKGRIITFNPYMEQISGYSAKEVKGKDWFETFLPEGIREKTREVFIHGLSGIPTKGYVNPVLARDGRVFQIEWYDRAIKGAGGNVESLLAIGIDVTERRKMEEEARRRLQELEVFYKASVGREERIIELKKEIEALRKGQ